MNELDTAHYIDKLEEEIRSYQVRVDNDALRMQIQSEMIGTMRAMINSTVKHWGMIIEEFDSRRDP